MKLKIRNATRKSQVDLNQSYNPINLDYIFEEDDPLSEWLEERERPLLDGQNMDWLSDDDEPTTQPSDAQQNNPAGPSTSGGGGDDDDDDSGSDDDDDDNDGSAPPATYGGETFVPSTYPHDVTYATNVDAGTSSHDVRPPPSPRPPPSYELPPYDHHYHSSTYYQPHSSGEDNYNLYGYGSSNAVNYGGDSSGSNINYGYGDTNYGYSDDISTESTQYDPQSSTTQPVFEPSRSHVDALSFADSLFIYQREEEPPAEPPRHSFWW